MTREQRRDIFEAIGIVAIVASLIFLALEIRQNSELMKAQSRTEMAHDTVELLILNVGNTDFLDVWNRGNAGEELTVLEQTQFAYTYYAWIWHWNNVAYLHRVGLYDEAEYALQINIVRGEIDEFPGFKTFWCDNRQRIASLELIDAIEGTSGGDLCGH